MKRLLFLALMLLGWSGAATFPVHAAATTLGDGDIAIVAYQSDNPDQFAFVLLADVGSGTEINFTDKGWQSDQTFRDNEGIVTWTADQDYPFGWVIAITIDDESTASTGDIAKTGGSFLLSGEGDQLFAYQGELTSPTLLYALQMNSNWDAEASSPNKSTQPNADRLSNFAVCVPRRDNAVYNKTVISGTQAELLASINDCNDPNWTTSDDALTMPVGDTTEPTAVQLESMTVTIDEANRVIVSWETSQEVDHAGFNLYRRAADNRAASWEPINDRLIASLGTQAQGSVYQFTDTVVPEGTWEYLLEDVETDGDTYRHTMMIARVTVQSPTSVQLVQNETGTFTSTIPLVVMVLLWVTGLGVWRDRRNVNIKS